MLSDFFSLRDRSLAAAVFGVSAVLLTSGALAGCLLDPQVQKQQEAQTIQLEIPIRASTVGEGDTLRAWVLPEGVMERELDEAPSGRLPDLGESGDYAELRERNQAAYGEQNIAGGGGADGPVATLEVELTSGRYHIQATVEPEDAEDDELYVAASYLDWDDPEGSLDGDRLPAVELAVGEAVAVSLELTEAGELTGAPVEDPPEPGTKIWSFQAGDRISGSSPAIAEDGTIYFGSHGDDNRVYALDSDGNQKWTFHIGRWIDSTPAIGADGTVYIQGRHNDYGHLYALDPEDGSEIWRFDALTTGSTDQSPAIGADGTIYASLAGEDWSTDAIYAVNPDDGSELWRFEADGSLSSPAIAEDGTIYVGSWDEHLYALDPDPECTVCRWQDEEYIWSFDAGEPVNDDVSIGPDGTVYAAGSSDNTLFAVSPEGEYGWEVDFAGRSVGIGEDGTLYLWPAGTGGIRAVRPDGTEKWYFDETDWTRHGPTVGADGTVFVAGDDERLRALDAQDGSQLWSFDLGDRSFSSPIVAPDGTVYVGTRSGELYAVASESPGLADSSWPTYGRNTRRTARVEEQ